MLLYDIMLCYVHNTSNPAGAYQIQKDIFIAQYSTGEYNVQRQVYNVQLRFVIKN